MNDKIFTKTPIVCVTALFCCALWGSASPAIKTGYAMFGINSADIAAQILFAGMRFVLAGILVMLFGSLLSRKPLIPKKSSVLPIVKLAAVQTVMQYVFFYIGNAHTSGVKVSIINGSNAFLAIFAAVFVFKQEKMTFRKMLACVLGFAGIVVINLGGEGTGTGFSLLGEGAIAVSAAAYALSSGMIKKYSQHENPVILSGCQFFLGGSVMCAAGFAAGGRITGLAPDAAMLLLYLAFISAAAYTLWGILLKYNPVARVAIFGCSNPIFGVILSALILGEGSQAFSIRGIIALVLVSVGIYIINNRKTE